MAIIALLSLFAMLAVMDSAFGFNNPIVGQGQDPSAKYYNGNYYLVQSYGYIAVMRASKLENLGQPDETVTVWTPTAPSGEELCCNIWAPELVFVEEENRWYIYFAADNGDNVNHRNYVLQGAGPDPLGPYTLLGKIAAAPTGDHYSIDSTVMNLNGQRYFIWSGWPADVDGQQNLYIAQMSSPSTLSTDRYLISSPTDPWEFTDDLGINEGPAVLQNQGSTYIAFSACASWDDRYCVGLLTYNGGDPLDQASWLKSNGCVFQQDPGNSAYGPGHNSFTTSPDGLEVWNVYHGIAQSGAGMDDRSIRAQKVNWNADGSPDFGIPASFEDWIDPPSGE